MQWGSDAKGNPGIGLARAPSGEVSYKINTNAWLSGLLRGSTTGESQPAVVKWGVCMNEDDANADEETIWLLQRSPSQFNYEGVRYLPVFALDRSHSSPNERYNLIYTESTISVFVTRHSVTVESQAHRVCANAPWKYQVINWLSIARLGSAYWGSAWPGPRPGAGPGTTLLAVSYFLAAWLRASPALDFLQERGYSALIKYIFSMTLQLYAAPLSLDSSDERVWKVTFPLLDMLSPHWRRDPLIRMLLPAPVMTAVLHQDSLLLLNESGDEYPPAPGGLTKPDGNSAAWSDKADSERMGSTVPIMNLPSRRRVAAVTALSLWAIVDRWCSTLASYVSCEKIRGNLPFPRVREVASVLHEVPSALISENRLAILSDMPV
ncbi:hypothetical protein BGY98DRAFT_1165593 [Russula aff. rugulosa BPL654]|nr:hypothetical protein BGY98DRAFT_1165593 [Russula aff. rugulosa BPL654]